MRLSTPEEDCIFDLLDEGCCPESQTKKPKRWAFLYKPDISKVVLCFLAMVFVLSGSFAFTSFLFLFFKFSINYIIPCFGLALLSAISLKMGFVFEEKLNFFKRSNFENKKECYILLEKYFGEHLAAEYAALFTKDLSHAYVSNMTSNLANCIKAKEIAQKLAEENVFFAEKMEAVKKSKPSLILDIVPPEKHKKSAKDSF